MTRTFAATITLLSAGAAHAHPGHLDTVSGHSHWELLGGIALLALAGVGLWKVLSKR
ncbi:MAG: DUF6732 family protein [Pseudomonadota bacterium]